MFNIPGSFSGSKNKIHGTKTCIHTKNVIYKVFNYIKILVKVYHTKIKEMNIAESVLLSLLMTENDKISHAPMP